MNIALCFKKRKSFLGQMEEMTSTMSIPCTQARPKKKKEENLAEALSGTLSPVDFVKGDIVMRCDHDIRKARDYWLNQGREPAKSNAERWYKDMEAERGTVVEVKSNEHGPYLIINWGGNKVSHTLPYKVKKAP